MELLKPGADDSIIPAGNPQPESTQEENTRNKNKSQFLLQNRWLVISQKEKKNLDQICSMKNYFRKRLKDNTINVTHDLGTHPVYKTRYSNYFFKMFSFAINDIRQLPGPGLWYSGLNHHLQHWFQSWLESQLLCF